VNFIGRKKGDIEEMPEIKTQIVTEPKEGQEYIITFVEKVIVESRDGKKYDALKVLLKSVNEKDVTEYSLTLWLTDTASPTSKLGSFVGAFEDFLKDYVKACDTDNWLQHTVKVIIWRDKNRKIEVIS